MTSDDTAGPGTDQGRAHDMGAADQHRDRDHVREFLLGIAAQIDQLATLFAPDGAGSSAGSAGSPVSALLAEVPGEITSLLSEIGDLIARLIAALIAVLEAIAKALRSSPQGGPAPAPRYQPIAVRIDADSATTSGVRQPDGES